MGTHTEVEDTVLRNCIMDNCKVKVTTLNSTAGRISNDGISQLASTGAVTLIMQAPEAGKTKRLVKSSTSTAVLTVTSPTTTVLFNAAGNTNLAFDAADDVIELFGLSATRWLVMSNTGVALS